MATSPMLQTPSAGPRLRRKGRKPASLTLFPPAVRHGTSEPLCEVSPPPPGPDRSRKPALELVGIARLAASSPRVESKCGTEYFLLPVRSILNECHSDRMPFRWTVNPYRGCEFGCRYCYARYTHEYLRLEPAEFETKIFAKQSAGALAARDLDRERIIGEHIAIGTATDPYQPAEREFGATRTILGRMAEREGLSLSITTKSDQVVRDLDLLRRISARSSLSVNVTITTLRPRLARLLEPRAPRPDLRLQAVRRLRDAGISVGVFAMPVIPGLTDREEDLDALARAARDAGAEWLVASVLFLMPAAWKTFLAFLESRFPKLAGQYRTWYTGYGEAPEYYRRRISEQMAQLRAKYSLPSHPESPTPACQQSQQFALQWSAGGCA